MKKNTYKDFKSAAAGDDCEDAVRTPIVLGGLRTLQTGLNGLGAGQRMGSGSKAPPAPLNRSGEIYDFGGNDARRVMQFYPAAKMTDDVRSFYSAMRISVEIAPTEKTPMPMGVGGYYRNSNLNQEPLSPLSFRDIKHDSHRVEMTQEHPFIRRYLLSRNNLEDVIGSPILTMMFTIGFYLIDKGEIYLGKSKLFFPKHHDEMWIYFDISQQHMQ